MDDFLNPSILIYVMVVVLFLLLIFLITILNHNHNQTQTAFNTYDKRISQLNEKITNKKSQLDKLSNKVETKQPRTQTLQIHEKLIDSLDFMLNHQIITPTEYNQLITKSLPYLNG